MIKTGRKSSDKKEGLFRGIKSALPAREWLCVAAAVVSLFSDLGDVKLTALSLIFLQTAKERTAKYITGCAVVIWCLFTVIHTAEYIPYISFVLVYLAADYLLDRNSQKAVYPALLTFALSKAYLLTFGYESFYWAVFVVELLAVGVVPSAAKSGFEILGFNKPMAEFSSVSEVVCAFVSVALALDGVHINGLRLSVAFLLSAAWFYGLKNNIPLSLAAAFSMILSLCQERHFLYLFAGFGAIYIIGTYLVTKGWQGYTVLVGSSAAVSLALLSRFNSFVFLTVTGLAAAGCFVMMKKTAVTAVSYEDEDIIAGEKEYLDLLTKVEKLNRCFSFLGHTVMDISQLIAKDFIPTQAEDMAAGQVCRRCKNNTLCWQENFSYTQGQFSQYASSLSKGKSPQFDSLFLSRCDKTDRLHSALTAATSLAATQRLLTASARHSQKMLQNQFLSMAEILRQITFQSNRSGIYNAAATGTMDVFLRNMGKRVNHCLCYQNRDKCIISACEDFSPQEIYRIKTKLENIYNTKFSLPEISQERDNIIYTFCQENALKCEYAIKSSAANKNCGDCCEYICAEDTAFVILADGMGTGTYAAAESRTAVEMLKSMLCASVQPATALEILNIALNLKGTGQSCVAVDILAVDLNSGQCTLCKAGGAETFVISGGKAKAFYRDSLPVGILKDTKIWQTEFAVSNGDSIVMVSDGAQPDRQLLQKLTLVNSSADGEYMAGCIVNSGDKGDDATAAVLKITGI